MKSILILLSLIVFGCKDKSIESSSKWKKLSHSDNSITQLSGKARSLLQSKIILQHQVDDNLVLHGTITPMDDMDRIEAEWKLPKHIKIIEGHLKETLTIPQGETISHEITIKKSSMLDGDRIFFFAYQMKDGQRVGSSAQYFHEKKKTENKDKHRFNKISEKKKRKLIQ